jgi:AmmeMemoRadiSam system protein B
LRASTVPSLYDDAEPFSSAIDRAVVVAPALSSISGLTVPHHLVAADLIASAFQIVESQPIQTAVILVPDHFRKSRLPFATTRRDFSTIFGVVRTRCEDVGKLLNAEDLVEESDLFAKDHGIGGILPFLKHALPNAEIIPIAVSVYSTRGDWDRLLTLLLPLMNPKTLIVQSTDFSHYLRIGRAIRRDQQSLNILATESLEEVEKLSQPNNIDSRGAQYIQLRLQRDYFNAGPLVLFNSNQQFYSAIPEVETTSYIVEVFDRSMAARVGPDVAGSDVYCFAGDTFLGRSLGRLLLSPKTADRVIRAVSKVLRGCRLVLNLEGVTFPQIPANLPVEKLAMPENLAIEWLRALNVVAVSVANNHANDFGAETLDRMVHNLSAAGLIVLRHGEEADLGPFRLIALTDLDNSRNLDSRTITSDTLEAIVRSSARPPFFAFLHWGTEYVLTPSERQLAIANELQRAEISLIVGAYPHVATDRLQLLRSPDGIMAVSLGNFLFDQTSKIGSGAVLEVRIFRQGTFFARLIPIPNFFEEALRNEPAR